MLRKQQNDLLTQTGPGTPMGAGCSAATGCRRCWRGAARERMPAGAGQAPVGAADRLCAIRKGAMG